MPTTPSTELLHLAPTAVEIDANVRLDARLDREFLASIAEHGVLAPVTAVRLPDGTIALRDGQRRTQAARQVGLATIPVVVHPAEGDAEATTLRTRRVIEQIVINDHRLALTDAERARGIHQLLLDGISPTKIAKGLSTSKEIVAAAAAASASDQTMTALDTGQLSLTEAVRFTDFEDDPSAQAELIEVAGTDQFAHRYAQLVTRREDRRRYAAAAQAYTQRGYTVIDADRRPGYCDTTHIPSTNLTDAAGNRLTAERIAEMDPQHWAIWLSEATAWVDATTGEAVDEGLIDWDTEDDPSCEPAEGLRHANSVTETTIWEPHYYCLDPAGAAITMPGWLARNYGLDPDVFAPGAHPKDAEELARAQAAAEEKASAERRKLLALNKLGAAAETVRRQWVSDLLTRKTLPKGAAMFLVERVSTQTSLLDDYHGKKIAAALLGLRDTQTAATAVAELPATGEARALVILLGMVLGSLEAATPKDAWRTPRKISKDYLKFLEDNGYPLADIEKVVIGARRADAVYRQSQ